MSPECISDEAITRNCNLLVFYHPLKPDTATLALALEAQNRRLWPSGRVTVVPMEADATGNAEIIQDITKEHGPSHIIPLSGDGGLHNVLKGIRQAKIPSLVVPVAMGTANDLARSLLRRDLTDPIGTLNSGRLARLPWLDISLHHPDGSIEEEIAQNYFGTHFTGIGADYVNSPAYREKANRGRKLTRYMRDAMEITRLLPNTQPILIEDPHTGKVTPVLDRVILNISRMGKTQWLDRKHTFRHQANQADIKGRGLSDLVIAARDIRLGKTVLRPGEEVTFIVYKGDRVGDQQLLAQADGEIIELQNGTTITIKLSDNTQTFATTY